MEDFENKTLVCCELNCGKEFIWTIGEQEFIHDLKEKGKLDEQMPDGSIKEGEVKSPRRCPECRKIKKAQRASAK